MEGFAFFALNQGEVCTCPSRALVQESIYDRFMERAIKRVEAIAQGDPLDTGTMIGAQASQQQYDKILRQDIEIPGNRPQRRREGAHRRRGHSARWRPR
jgi:aldehyde dehydrogenase